MELVGIHLVSIILFLFIFKKHELAGGIWDVKNSNHGLWLVKLMENHHYFEKKKIDAKIDRCVEQNKLNYNPEKCILVG